jgi:asparagine synthase (glutamine-hydrolysing)
VRVQVVADQPDRLGRGEVLVDQPPDLAGPVLPRAAVKRRTMGFAVPIGEWFRGDLRPMLRDHLFAADSFAAAHFNRAVVERLVEEHERERVDHSQRLYALLMIELWWRGQK